MDNIELIFKLSYKFLCKYLIQYLKLLVKPIAIAGVGLVFLILAFQNPYFAILSFFITIPSFCYAFWQGYIITYSLNLAAYNFIKKDKAIENFDCLQNCYTHIKKNEKELAIFVTKSAAAMVILFLPFLLFAAKNISISSVISDPFSLIALMPLIMAAYIINNIFAIPFTNYFNQSFFFKKNGETFLDLFLNCYKKLDLKGYILAAIITLAAHIAGVNLLIYVLIILPFNVVVYSANTFWYYSRIKK